MKQLIYSLFLFGMASASAQQTVGLIDYEFGNEDGYVLFSPMSSTETFLIDKCGQKVNTWSSSDYRPALSAYLLEDGSLLRTGQFNNPDFDEGGSGGIIERFDWNGNLNWSYTLSNQSNCLHHDIHALPNGNIICIVWDSYTTAEGIANGMDPAYPNQQIWSEKIVELQPVGANDAIVVWEWKLWDHLVQEEDASKPNFGTVSEHPELVDLNYFLNPGNGPDWVHLNSIDYNPDHDQVLVSSHTFNEVWIIDHSTSTAEAATHAGGNSGKGGDLLYRWGNPQTYQRGNPTTKKLYAQHHATWIPNGYPNAGKILVFNNGLNRPGNFSSIDMIDPPIDGSNNYSITASEAFLPTELFWTYTANPASDFYSSNISGVYPLENGSFMITNGRAGTFFEIDSENQTLWKYINPITMSGAVAQGSVPTNNLVFRANFYPSNYAGLSGQNLVPMGEIELNPTIPSICELVQSSNSIENSEIIISVYPNPFAESTTISYENREQKNALLTIYTLTGQQVKSISNSTGKIYLNREELPAGVYFYQLRTADGHQASGKLVMQ